MSTESKAPPRTIVTVRRTGFSKQQQRFRELSQRFVDHAFEYDERLAMFPFADTYRGMLTSGSTAEAAEAGMFVVLYSWESKVERLDQLSDEKHHDQPMRHRWRTLASLKEADQVFLKDCAEKLKHHNYQDTVPVAVGGIRAPGDMPMVFSLHWLRNRSLMRPVDWGQMIAVLAYHCQHCGKHPTAASVGAPDAKTKEDDDDQVFLNLVACPLCQCAFYCCKEHRNAHYRSIGAYATPLSSSKRCATSLCGWNCTKSQPCHSFNKWCHGTRPCAPKALLL